LADSSPCPIARGPKSSRALNRPWNGVPGASQDLAQCPNFVVIHRTYEFQHPRHRVRTLGSRPPRPPGHARRQGARGFGRAGGPSGRARWPPGAFPRSRLWLALQLLHAGPSPLRRCRLQSHRGGSELPALPPDPRAPGFGLPDPDLRPPAGKAPYGGEPRVRPRQGQGKESARDRRPDCRAGAPPRHSEHRAKAALPHGDTTDGDTITVGRAWAGDDQAALRGRPCDRPFVVNAAGHASPDRPGLGARALPLAVQHRPGGTREAAAVAGASPPRDPRRRSGRDLRLRPHGAARKGREEEARGGRQATVKPGCPSPD
jgi:hypothetical protein